MIKKIDIRKEKNGYAVYIVDYEEKTALLHNYTERKKSEVVKILEDIIDEYRVKTN